MYLSYFIKDTVFNTRFHVLVGGFTFFFNILCKVSHYRSIYFLNVLKFSLCGNFFLSIYSVFSLNDSSLKFSAYLNTYLRDLTDFSDGKKKGYEMKGYRTLERKH